MISHQEDLIKEFTRSNQPLLLIIDSTQNLTDELPVILKIRQDLCEAYDALGEGVEELRNKISSVFSKPISGKNKLFYISNAQSLSKEQANTLLKILEEPPEHLLIVLSSTNLSTVLQTIRSRCKSIVFKTGNYSHERDSTILTLLELPMVEYVSEVSKMTREEFGLSLNKGLEELKETRLNKEAFFRFKKIANILSNIYNTNVNYKLLAESLYVSEKTKQK